MANPLEKTETRPITFETAKKNFEAIKKKLDARRPTLEDFSAAKGGPFSADEVARDLAWVTMKKKQIFVQGARGVNAEMEEKRLYAEYVFMEMVDSGELFDNDTVAVMPGSEYDDLNNGADAVVTFCDDEGNVDFAFSVDVKAALTAESENVEKIERLVREKIYSGIGSSVKYFMHKNVETGEVSRRAIEALNLVLWIEPENVKDLMNASSKKEKEKTQSDVRFLNRFRELIYQEINAQSEKISNTLRSAEEQAAPPVSKRLDRIRHQNQKLKEKVAQYK